MDFIHSRIHGWDRDRDESGTGRDGIDPGILPFTGDRDGGNFDPEIHMSAPPQGSPACTSTTSVPAPSEPAASTPTAYAATTSAPATSAPAASAPAASAPAASAPGASASSERQEPSSPSLDGKFPLSSDSLHLSAQDPAAAQSESVPPSHKLSDEESSAQERLMKAVVKVNLRRQAKKVQIANSVRPARPKEIRVRVTIPRVHEINMQNHTFRAELKLEAMWFDHDEDWRMVEKVARLVYSLKENEDPLRRVACSDWCKQPIRPNKYTFDISKMLGDWRSPEGLALANAPSLQKKAKHL